ncbi:hypothetical protein BUALT_Bualt05G0111000 [Buddleja alternifolia]|uniref:Bet v I/Major latex protein domain-containing protein n=1 Tax=Buddleja alternifolia TaxID=168488 RepID=A0AAV6XRI4_9LAMI|nr:hypothetical protein BUALT_Bualt05G0111000 [Buddleja alternifolia]
MGPKGELVSQISIKSDGDVIIELFRDKPHHLPNICPDLIESVDLHSGQWGVVGSVVIWKYLLEGKKGVVSKDIIEATDEKKKSVTYNLMEGDLQEHYKTMKFTISVDTSEEDDVVTLIFEYEKNTEDVPVPYPVMDATVSVIKALERYQLQVPT